MQQTWKINPINVRKSEEEKNQTYGQPYIMARMLADVIKIKAKGSAGLLWVIGIAVLGYIGYAAMTGGL